jgi:hypothetical protein
MSSTSGRSRISNFQIAVVHPNQERLLSRPEFQGLSAIPPEVEWFANLENEIRPIDSHQTMIWARVTVRNSSEREALADLKLGNTGFMGSRRWVVLQRCGAQYKAVGRSVLGVRPKRFESEGV